MVLLEFEKMQYFIEKLFIKDSALIKKRDFLLKK